MRCSFRNAVALAMFLGLALQPAHAQEREWSFDTGGEDAYLVFGVPETDDVGVSFWCAVGTGEIRIFLPQADGSVPAGQKVMLEVTAARDHFNLEGETASNEEARTTSAEAHVESTDKMFADLLSADRFKVKIGKEESVCPLEGADFESLLRVCARH
jgi:hypothetical protein